MHPVSRDLTLGHGSSRTKGPLRGKEANKPQLHVILPTRAKPLVFCRPSSPSSLPGFPPAVSTL
jgi:hypothetical protein